MRVRISKNGFSCAPEGHTTFHFQEGQIVTGRVADMALSAGCGVDIDAKTETKIAPPSETKRAPGRPRKKAE